MAETEAMTIDERRKYLHKMRIRYWQAKRKRERSRLRRQDGRSTAVLTSAIFGVGKFLEEGSLSSSILKMREWVVTTYLWRSL